VLERVADASAETVAELPFVKPALTEAQRAVWSKVPWKKRRVEDAGGGAAWSASEFLASDAARGVVLSPEQAMRPDGVAMLPPSAKDAPGAPRRALVVGVAVYGGMVTRDKVEDQVASTDLSCAFLSQQGVTYAAVQARREAWCAARLNRAVSVRVHVVLPGGPEAPVGSENEKESSVNGGSMQALAAGVERDVMVTLDASNVHLLLGPRSTNKELYELLQIATGTEASDWKG